MYTINDLMGAGFSNRASQIIFNLAQEDANIWDEADSIAVTGKIPEFEGALGFLAGDSKQAPKLSNYSKYIVERLQKVMELDTPDAMMGHDEPNVPEVFPKMDEPPSLDADPIPEDISGGPISDPVPEDTNKGPYTDPIPEDINKGPYADPIPEDTNSGPYMSGGIPDRISRGYVKANPDKVFLFGDNLKGYGMGGQAKEMRGEPNAIGIPTKKEPSMRPEAFFTDAEFDMNKVAIDKALSRIPQGKEVVIPKAGFGTGLARLNETAPKTFEYLQQRLAELSPKEGGGGDKGTTR